MSSSKEEIKREICYHVFIPLFTKGLATKPEADKEFTVYEYKVHRAQGCKVKQFISSYGQKAKTDKIDAKMLTIYGAKMQETLRLRQQDQGNQLKELVSHREDFKDVLQKERNRKRYFDNKVAKRSI